MIFAVAPVWHEDKLSVYTSGNWVFNGKDSFGYTGTSMQVTYDEQARWDIPSQTWQYTYGTYKNYNQLDANDRIGSTLSVYNAGSGLDTDGIEYFYYDANGFLDSVNGAGYNKVTHSYTPADGLLRFYYETPAPTGISHQNYSRGDVAVYPNPAATRLNLRMDAAASFQIVNLSGQSVIAGTATNGGIDIGKLPVGTYIIRLRDIATGEIYTKSFVKR